MKNAFVNSAGILTGWGYAASNGTDAVVQVADDFNLAPGAWQYANGGWVEYSAPGPTLSDAQTAQAAIVKVACAAAIAIGFSSSALGSACSYGGQTEDQANIATAAASANGGALWCENSAGAWSLTAHTQAQAEQVRTDLWAHIQAQQATYAKLLGEIAAATTVAAVEAVVWA